MDPVFAALLADHSRVVSTLQKPASERYRAALAARELCAATGHDHTKADAELVSAKTALLAASEELRKIEAAILKAEGR